MSKKNRKELPLPQITKSGTPDTSIILLDCFPNGINNIDQAIEFINTNYIKLLLIQLSQETKFSDQDLEKMRILRKCIQCLTEDQIKTVISLLRLKAYESQMNN
ncbi:MAG: hypothetical protein H6772_04960 [Pseudomonadales bacterium]|nr:hypothetical protein [Pseudomonadales bacterium]